MRVKTIVVGNLRGGVWETCLEMQRRVYSTEGLCPTLKARMSCDDESLAIKFIEDEHKISTNPKNK